MVERETLNLFVASSILAGFIEERKMIMGFIGNIHERIFDKRRFNIFSTEVNTIGEPEGFFKIKGTNSVPNDGTASFFATVTPCVHFNFQRFGEVWFYPKQNEMDKTKYSTNPTVYFTDHVNRRIARLTKATVVKNSYHRDTRVEPFEYRILKETIYELEFSWLFWVITFRLNRIVVRPN